MRPCRALRSAAPFRRVQVRSCRPTIQRNVQLRSRRVRRVANGPRRPAFRGAVLTLRRTKGTLSQIAAILFGLLDTRAYSTLRRVTRGLAPTLSRRTGGVDLGRRLFTHMGTICSGERSLRLAPRRHHLLRGSCSNFIHGKTGLSRRSGTAFQGLDVRLDDLALGFSRGRLGRAGNCRLILRARSRLTKLPRDTVRTTTRATRRGKGRNY